MRQNGLKCYLRRREQALHNKYVGSARSNYDTLFSERPRKPQARPLSSKAEKVRTRQIEHQNFKLLMTLNSIQSRKSLYKRKPRSKSRDFSQSLRARANGQDMLAQNLRLLRKLEDAKPSPQHMTMRQHQRRHSRLLHNLGRLSGHSFEERRASRTQDRLLGLDQQIIMKEVALDE